MKTIKVSKTVTVGALSGAALEWAVTKCEGADVTHLYAWDYSSNRYSTDWAQGGPIIERENISTCWEGTIWVATRFNKNCGETWFGHQYGSTPLIAAMRCYVASKLGDNIDIPEELI